MTPKLTLEATKNSNSFAFMQRSNYSCLIHISLHLDTTDGLKVPMVRVAVLERYFCLKKCHPTVRYSWDMMIHSFSQQHIKITYKNGVTGEVGYLKKDAFMGTARSRWTMHPDMLKQYATCVAQRLIENYVEQPELYFDVWKSMNERFYQRVYDPRVDIVASPWAWNKKPDFTMPLLTGLSDWRTKLKELEKEIETEDIDVTFVADYPGLSLENYLSPDLDNTTIELMGGQVYVTLDEQDEKRIDLEIGNAVKLPPGEFHTVHATGEEPVMYMYIYQNTTDIEYKKKYRGRLC